MKIIFIFFLFPLIIFASEQKTLKQDLEETFNLSVNGFKSQVDAAHFDLTLWSATAALSVSFDQDKRIVNHYGKQEKNTYLEILDASGTIANFNLIPLSFYFIGRNSNNKKYQDFAKDSIAAWIIVSVETMIISFVPIHDRPIGNNSEEISMWEEQFRGDSSFPSGHVTPLYILTLESYHHFGFSSAIIPFAFSMGVTYERVQSKKHYLSDVVGSMFLAFSAVEGIRAHQNKNTQTVSFAPLFGHDLLGLAGIYQF